MEASSSDVRSSTTRPVATATTHSSTNITAGVSPASSKSSPSTPSTSGTPAIAVETSTAHALSAAVGHSSALAGAGVRTGVGGGVDLGVGACVGVAAGVAACVGFAGSVEAGEEVGEVDTAAEPCSGSAWLASSTSSEPTMPTMTTSAMNRPRMARVTLTHRGLGPVHLKAGGWQSGVGVGGGPRGSDGTERCAV